MQVLMFAARIAAAVQTALSESPAARTLCTQLAGRSLRVIATGTPFAGTIRCDGHALQLDASERAAANSSAAADAACRADATLTGSPLALLALAGPGRRDLVARGSVTIDGEVEVAEQFARLAALLRPDVEQLLSMALGRTTAHGLARGARGSWAFGTQLLGGLLRSTADYLVHERRELLSSAEAQHFYHQVDELRARVERLDTLLAARAAGGSS
jgi:ubiquinone biosynthesis protein UbiJ